MTTLAPPSYCMACDAEEGECGHSGPRYLEPPMYYGSKGAFAVPAIERSRFDHNPFTVSAEDRAPKARPMGTLIHELEPWVYFDAKLLERFEVAYEKSALKLSLLCASLRVGLESGRVQNGAGTLVNRLREVLD